MGDDGLRARILARRAALVAAAVSAVASTECSKAAACLSVATLDDGAAPVPCLSAPLRPRDAGALAPTVDDAGLVHLPPMRLRADAGAAPPMPCLSVVAPLAPPTAPPRPCLEVTAPPPPPSKPRDPGF